MIIDLRRFVEQEQVYWTRLERMLERLVHSPTRRQSLAEVKSFHYLYQRASADLAKLQTFASEPHTQRYLESLVSRAYGEIHETRRRSHAGGPLRWFFRTFPRTFRRHRRAFWLSVAVTLGGVAFGALAVMVDPQAKEALMPLPHLRQDPARRVDNEESAQSDRLEGRRATFSAYLMTHNIRVSVFVMALGVTWGVGTIIVLFTNGVLLGAVAFDYVAAGEGIFLLGWLMPHGVVEIPAILLAGQTGLVLAGALIGRGSRLPTAERLRAVAGDIVTLVGGVAVLLVWAGVVESFMSQYHEPHLPYSLKIGFGAVEMILLWLFLTRSGRWTSDGARRESPAARKGGASARP